MSNTEKIHRIQRLNRFFRNSEKRERQQAKNTVKFGAIAVDARSYS